jgi:hypothetical protein
MYHIEIIPDGNDSNDEIRLMKFTYLGLLQGESQCVGVAFESYAQQGCRNT